jgi:AcrR family transcriptional regulator
MMSRMTQIAPIEDPRPYHHGDLRRALIEAASRILEADGPSALSLRAVAREAGVSPAAPYHHFKDKGELLDAIARLGWDTLDEAMLRARETTQTPGELVTELGVAYVTFARSHPSLYRVMYDGARSKESLPPEVQDDEDSAYCQVRSVFKKFGGAELSALDIELATIASWCAAHGLAEMSSFKHFQPLKDELGGEEAFVRGVLGHLGMFGARSHPV